MATVQFWLLEYKYINKQTNSADWSLYGMTQIRIMLGGISIKKWKGVQNMGIKNITNLHKIIANKFAR